MPVSNGRFGAFQVHGLYFRQGCVLAIVLKTLDQQFKNDGYYFPEDNWQVSEDSAITSWDLAHLHGSLACLAYLGSSCLLLWCWWLHSCCDLSRRKNLNKICISLQRITETWVGKFPLMFKLWASASSKMTHVLCYSKRGGIDTWKLLLKIMQKALAIFFQKEDVLLRTTLASVNVIFKVILRFQNYCVVWVWSVGTLASCW